MQSVGLSLDWSREIDTTDPAYYKWTQWMFLKFFEKGLAYKDKTFINWCPKDKIGLANEEAAGGVCDRCGGPVEKKEKEQWLIRITDYAEKLLQGLEEVDYIPQAKIQQQNWIGRSEGAEIEFAIAPSVIASTRSNPAPTIKVFTTRPDTLFGATYLVLAPEHALVDTLKPQIKNWDVVSMYAAAAKVKSEMERSAADKEKTGVELKGVKAINPATKEEIPVWISDFVLTGYGTGAIMSVPAHDERDAAFAEKFALPSVRVVAENGTLIESGEFNGMDSETAKAAIAEKFGGKMTSTYRLRDWSIGRQRYWGVPIPIVYDPEGTAHPIPKEHLPWILPTDVDFTPTGIPPHPRPARTAVRPLRSDRTRQTTDSSRHPRLACQGGPACRWRKAAPTARSAPSGIARPSRNP
jgi:leucyl-tRNA synthetase